MAARIDLSKEKTGAAPSAFLPIVGDWVVAEDGGAKLVRVDGREWKSGQPAAGIADTARALYGARHEAFFESVKSFAYFPIAAARDIDDFRDGEISVRFRLLGGQLDQCAGILFDLKSNGDYLTVRYNLKDTNVVLWTFNKGVRTGYTFSANRSLIGSPVCRFYIPPPNGESHFFSASPAECGRDCRDVVQDHRGDEREAMAPQVANRWQTAATNKSG